MVASLSRTLMAIKRLSNMKGLGSGFYQGTVTDGLVKLIDKGIKSFKSEPIEMESSGNLAFFVGKYKLYGSENQEISHGKYISVFKNIDGKWKVHRDIFNRSTPLEEK